MFTDTFSKFYEFSNFLQNIPSVCSKLFQPSPKFLYIKKCSLEFSVKLPPEFPEIWSKIFWNFSFIFHQNFRKINFLPIQNYVLTFSYRDSSKFFIIFVEWFSEYFLTFRSNILKICTKKFDEIFSLKIKLTLVILTHNFDIIPNFSNFIFILIKYYYNFLKIPAKLAHKLSLKPCKILPKLPE